MYIVRLHPDVNLFILEPQSQYAISGSFPHTICSEIINNKIRNLTDPISLLTGAACHLAARVGQTLPGSNAVFVLFPSAVFHTVPPSTFDFSKFHAVN